MTEEKQKITGYRNLTDTEISLINEAKALAEQVGMFVDRVKNTDNIDKRWVSIGVTDLQTGFMSLIRAITQPTTF